MGDFETTVFEGQEHTEVWASASVELYTEDVKIFNSIDEQWDYFVSLKSNLIVYYHNLKFDGSFWLPFLLEKKGFTQGFTKFDLEENDFEFKPSWKLQNKELSYMISEMGQWYTITIKYNNKIIEFRDSLKLLPYSVERIGKSFGTSRKKTNIKYEGFRYAGCEITDQEKEYIANDVLVVKEAIEIMHDQGNKKLTIGSCCLYEFKKGYDEFTYDRLFPNLADFDINENVFQHENADRYIRQSYKGGWCYVVPQKASKVFKNGVTIDVNSLYPSVMHSSSGNRYPVGTPTFWKGNYIPEEALTNDRYYFIRFRANFYIKQNKLPFIQIKGNPLYRGNDMLSTSEMLGEDGRYYNYYINDLTNKVSSTAQTLTMTMTDYKLMLEHYDVKDFEILDGCWFETASSIFDSYIDKYMEIKMNSSGAIREQAKLFLNNLYGKMASNTDSSFKIAYFGDQKQLRYITALEDKKKPGYIAIGSAITSYAREFTIRAAQANYYGPDNPGFIYADTDSIHVDIPLEKIKGVSLDPVHMLNWSIDGVWSEGYFERQKTYIEKLVPDDSKKHLGYKQAEIEYDVKAAGMPKKAQSIFKRALENRQLTDEEILDKEYREETVKFINEGKTLEDFKVGLVVPQGNLKARNIRGGTILEDKPYVMRAR